MAVSTTDLPRLAHPALRDQISRVPYLPGLDGLRALAVIGGFLRMVQGGPGLLQGGAVSNVRDGDTMVGLPSASEQAGAYVRLERFDARSCERGDRQDVIVRQPLCGGKNRRDL